MLVHRSREVVCAVEKVIVSEPGRAIHAIPDRSIFAAVQHIDAVPRIVDVICGTG
jgi:hypothetical protein